MSDEVAPRPAREEEEFKTTDHEASRLATEKMPDAYDKDFPKVRSKISEIVRGLLKTIPDELQDSPVFAHLVNTAKNVSKGFSDAPSKHQNKIVGKSGAGKSSLINCLLDRPQLAKSLAASKACTHVPATYESGFPTQTKRFAAKIDFFEEHEIRTKIEFMLKDYYASTFLEEEDLSNEEKVELATAANTTLDAFRSLFCEKHDFSSKHRAQQFLARSYSDHHSNVVELLVGWCLELKIKAIGDDSTKPFDQQFDDQDELAYFTAPFGFSSTQYSKTALWPLVKMIKHGLLDIPILEYVTLTDWPGSDDTNRLRARAAAESNLHCDELWLVSPVSRIGSDPVIESHLVRYNEDVPCTIICTYIEENLDAGLATYLRDEEGQNMEEHDKLLDKENSLSQKIQDCERWLAESEQAKKGQFITSPGNKRRRISRHEQDHMIQSIPSRESELLRLQREQKRTGQSRINCLAAARTEFVTRIVSENFFKRFEKARLLNSFCVSNLHYDQQKTGLPWGATILPVERTGLPQLRQYIFDESARRNLNTVKEFINGQVKGLLDGAAVVAAPDRFGGIEHALETIQGKQSELGRLCDDYFVSIKIAAADQLINPLVDKQDDFAAAAERDLEKKMKKWHWASIHAFVRHEGCHFTTKQSECSWNQDFMEKAVRIMVRDDEQGLWQLFEGEEHAKFNVLEESLVQTYEAIPAALQERRGIEAPKEFSDFINGQARQIRSLCHLGRATICQSLRHIKNESTHANGEYPQSYFNVAMRDGWKRCQEFRGRGATANMKTALKAHLNLPGERSPFRILADRTQTAIISEMEDELNMLRKQVEGIFGDTCKWLRAMSEKSVSQSPLRALAGFIFGRSSSNDQNEVDTLVRLRAFVVQAKQKIEGVSELVEYIERRCEL